MKLGTSPSKPRVDSEKSVEAAVVSSYCADTKEQIRGFSSAPSGSSQVSSQRALWFLRENIPRAEKLLGGSIKHDVSIPISQMSELISELRGAIANIDGDARLSIYGHVGDGNVHFNVLPPQGVAYLDYKKDKANAISTRVHDIAAEQFGSFSAEHGVGKLKTDELEKYTTAEGLRLMQTLKRALDPENIMNPGKVIPTHR